MYVHLRENVMSDEDALTQHALKQLLHYDPESGELRWKVRPVYMFSDGTQSAQHNCNIWNGRYAGKIAGYRSKFQIQVRINSKLYSAHRIAYCMMVGRWPGLIDHADMDQYNNAWNNLREADKATNGQNRGAPKNNTSGVKGVYWDKTRAKWAADIHSRNRRYRLGRFDSLDDARAAYATAAHSLHKEFARPT